MVVGFATKEGMTNISSTKTATDKITRLFYHDSGKKFFSTSDQMYSSQVFSVLTSGLDYILSDAFFQFGQGDVIGVGWLKEGDIFFTKNGEYLGVAFRNVKLIPGSPLFLFRFSVVIYYLFLGKYYACFGIERGFKTVMCNFGHSPFRYRLSQFERLAEKGKHKESSKSSIYLSFIREGRSFFI